MPVELSFADFDTVTSDLLAKVSSAEIVYNSVNGNLFYNPNGSSVSFGDGSLFSQLTGAPILTAASSEVVV